MNSTIIPSSSVMDEISSVLLPSIPAFGFTDHGSSKIYPHASPKKTKNALPGARQPELIHQEVIAGDFIYAEIQEDEYQLIVCLSMLLY